MELSPAAITGVEFDQVRKGYDPEQVRSFLNQIARGVESMKGQLAEEQNRTRQAQARLAEAASVARPAETADAESISRALVLAQRTADAAIAEARAQAASIVAAAEERAQGLANDAEAKAADRILRAETEARRRGEEERARADAELREVVGRRDRTQAELERLERAIVGHRESVRGSIERLHEALSASLAFEAGRDAGDPGRVEVSVPPLREVPVAVATPAAGAPVGEEAVRAFFADSPDEDRWRPGASS
jgi:DivIVA domain-containing protein